MMKPSVFDNVISQVASLFLTNEAKATTLDCSLSFEAEILLLRRHVTGKAQREDAHIGLDSFNVEQNTLVKRNKWL